MRDLEKKTSDRLPRYAQEMAARHAAHAPELDRLVAELPLRAGQKALDLGSGDGTYLKLLARHVGPQGLVVGVDVSQGFLRWAERRCAAEHESGPVELAAAKFQALPFDDATFDLVWCAHSLISLQPPEQAVREMTRITRPGGYVAVLENDSMHEVVLPWPEDLELAIRQAELDAQRAATRRPTRYVGRRVRAMFLEAGLRSVKIKSYAIDRAAPLAKADAEFLRKYLDRLAEVVTPHLAPKHRGEFAALVDHESPDYLGRQPDLAMTWLEVVCRGQRSD